MRDAGGDCLAVTRRHGARINHVHCKDVRPAVLAQVRAEDWSFLDAVVAGVFTAPGDGGVDFAAFARLLADIGYSGWAVVEVEQDPVKAPPFEYAKMGRDHMTRSSPPPASRSRADLDAERSPRTGFIACVPQAQRQMDGLGCGLINGLVA